jgi:YesN/AraC family two-component response regulator
MDDFLTKPIDEKQLNRVLLKWIACQQEEAELENAIENEGPDIDGLVSAF